MKTFTVKCYTLYGEVENLVQTQVMNVSDVLTLNDMLNQYIDNFSLIIGTDKIEGNTAEFQFLNNAGEVIKIKIIEQNTSQ